MLEGDTLAGEVEFLSIMKPYRRPELARRLREALGH
jgi:hypothetical protein